LYRNGARLPFRVSLSAFPDAFFYRAVRSTEPEKGSQFKALNTRLLRVDILYFLPLTRFRQSRWAEGYGSIELQKLISSVVSRIIYKTNRFFSAG